MNPEYHKNWREQNPDYYRNWRNNNREKHNEYHRKYIKNWRIMKEKMIKFGIYLTGRDQETIEQMYKNWSKDYKIERFEFLRPAEVEKIICQYFNTTTYRVYKRGRKRPNMYHRQLIQYFMRGLTKLSDTQIGRRTGGFGINGFDRTTVVNNAKVIQNDYNTNKFRRAEIDEIELKLKS